MMHAKYILHCNILLCQLFIVCSLENMFCVFLHAFTTFQLFMLNLFFSGPESVQLTKDGDLTYFEEQVNESKPRGK